MPLDDRDYIKGSHPPNCTCVECTNRRLKKLRKEAHPNYILICPRCGNKSLWHNVKENKYECLNLKCMVVMSSPAATSGKIEQPTVSKNKESDGTIHYSNHVDSEVSVNNSSSKTKKADNRRGQETYGHSIQNWLIALLLIFALSIIGLGISMFVGSFIPFWLVFGFSFIYSVEKWLHYFTRKYKAIGKLYRFLLNLSILSLLGLLVWSGIKLFSQQFVQSPLAGTLIFLTEFAFFIWMWRVISKNSWRWPSMKLTLFFLLAVTIIFAFAGVNPFSDYKTSVTTGYAGWIESKEHSRFEKEADTKANLPVEVSRPAPTPTTVQQTPELVKPASEPVSPPRMAQTVVGYTDGEVEELIYALINTERQKFGMSALGKDPLLIGLAREHSVNMVEHQFFSHDRATDERDFGYGQSPGSIRGENISKTPARKLVPGPYLTPEELCEWAVSGWMASPGHRKNILEPKFIKTGVGVSRLGEHLYITQMFEGTY